MEKANKDFCEFIKDRISKTNRRNSNCAGTALYIVGELEEDGVINKSKSKEILSNLKRDFSPEKGYIVYWGLDGVPFHIGVILDELPLMVVHRSGNNGLLIKDSLDELNSYLFKHTELRPIYKIPSKLESFLI